MLIYPKHAITQKTINRFNYSLYRAIGINMLKYNNDSSTVFRVVSSLCDQVLNMSEDIPYLIKMTLDSMDFTGIDRISSYLLTYIPGAISSIQDDNVFSNYLIGYSKYTKKEYTLQYVRNEQDFIRHSLPVDMFLTGSITHRTPGYYDLSPYVKSAIMMNVENSQVTIDVFDGLSIFTKDSDENVKITLYGKDYINEDIEETIEIVDNVEYVTKSEFAYIEWALLVGCDTSISIQIHPYINGQKVQSPQNYIDREDFEEYKAILHVDLETSNLVLSKIPGYTHEYPVQPEAIERIKLRTVTHNEVVTTYYIDTANKLIYTSTDEAVEGIVTEKRFYCYPLIFPRKSVNTLDRLKTEYQAIRVEYYLDTINREATFYIFPTERHNGIESLNVFIKTLSDRDTYPSWVPGGVYSQDDEVAFNGAIYTCTAGHTATTIFDITKWHQNERLYLEGMLLELYREGIETNRLIIPFDELFAGDNNECILEFRTSGEQEGILPIYVFDPEIDPLYVKKLNDLIIVWENNPSNTHQWLIADNKSTLLEYDTFYVGGLGFGEEGWGGPAHSGSIIPIRFGGGIVEGISSVFLYKLTNVGSICLNDTMISNVYGTFYYTDRDGIITTSDTISAIRGSNTEV